MTAVTVTTDLIGANTLTTADATTGFNQSTDGGYNDGGSPSQETDFFIQGTACVSASHTKNGLNTNTLLYDAGATVTLPTDGAYLIWSFWASPPSLSTYSASPTGGLMTVVASSLGNGALYEASGSDFPPNPLGGWYCYAVNPNAHTNADSFGTAPTGDGQFIGMAVTATAQARGQPFAVDAIRAGRCSSIVRGGTSPDAAARFSDISDELDTNTNRYGIFQTIPGGFSMQGRLALGDGINEVRFDDLNRNITILNTPRVTENFNLIEIQNGTSVASIVNWTNITFVNAGLNDPVQSTASRGKFIMTDSANVVFTGCSFTDMDSFTFNAATQQNLLTDCTFRRCKSVTQGGASLTTCTFENTISNTALISTVSTMNDIDGCIFSGNNTSHAVDVGDVTSSTSINWNSTYDTTTYATTNVGNSAISAAGDSEVLLTNVSLNQILTINVVGNGVIPTYRNTGTGIVKIVAAATFSITNLIDQSEVRIINTDTNAILAGVETVGSTPIGEDGVTVSADPNFAGRFKVEYNYNQSDAPINAKIVVMNFDYIHFSQAVVLGTAGGELLVSQSLDRNYVDPD